MKKSESQFAIAIVLAAVLSAVTVRAQDVPAPHSVTERNEVHLLDIKPGCWQIITHTSITGLVVRSKQEILKEWAEKLTPQQQAQMPLGYLDQLAGQIQEGERKSKEQAERGGDTGGVVCSATEAQLRALETMAFGDAACSRMVQDSGQVFNMKTECPAGNSGPQSRWDTDFEMPDPQRLKGTVQSTPDVSKTIHQIMVFNGKWISEAAPHMPSGVTDVNGKKPLGPGPVAGLDPYRIVAMSNGKPIVAGFAWAWINLVPPPERRAYDGRLPELVQQLYSQFAVAEEAAKLHLDVEEPWRSKLERLGRDSGHDFAAATDYPGDPNVPPSLIAQWQNARLRVYWDAYLGRASTDANREALLQKIKEKYKITIVDRDFFNLPTRN